MATDRYARLRAAATADELYDPCASVSDTLAAIEALHSAADAITISALLGDKDA